MLTILTVIGLVSLVALLVVRRQQNERWVWLFKPLSSAMFVLVGLLAHTTTDYATWIVIGLILGALGDLLLIPSDKPSWFIAGLVSFLLGHIAYVVAFGNLLDINKVNFFIIVPLGFFASIVYTVLLPNFGSLRLPVLAYFIVISLMVFFAVNVGLDNDYATAFRQLVVLGAIAFYFSDLAVAIDRFVKPRFDNSIWGLPLYYIGQFMLAWSITQL